MRRLCRQIDLTLPTHPNIQSQEVGCPFVMIWSIWGVIVWLLRKCLTFYPTTQRHTSLHHAITKWRRRTPCGHVKSGAGFRAFLLAGVSERALLLVETDLQKDWHRHSCLLSQTIICYEMTKGDFLLLNLVSVYIVWKLSLIRSVHRFFMTIFPSLIFWNTILFL